MATKQEIRDYFAKFGKQGGNTRAKNMTPQERAESARKASQARWAKTDACLKEIDRKLKKLERKNKAARAKREPPRPHSLSERKARATK